MDRATFRAVKAELGWGQLGQGILIPNNEGNYKIIRFYTKDKSYWRYEKHK